MRKIIGSAATLFALVVLSGCGSSANNQNSTSSTPSGTSTSQNQQPTDNTNSTNKVSIQNFAFTPETLTVKKGTTVTWANDDSVAHTIKSNSFNSSNLAKGDTFKFTFDTPGTFNYSCGIHPSMTGKIIVE